MRQHARAAVLTVTLALAAFAGLTAAPPPPASAAVQACSSVGIYGVRGSGESSGFGKEVWPAVQALQNGLQSNGRTVATFPLFYTAASVDLLKPPANFIKHPTNPLAIADYVIQVKEYLASISNGTDALYTLLNSRARACPSETPVFIGYSQGAMVVRNELKRLSQNGQAALLSRVGGAGLIADPDKQRNEPNIADAAALSQGVATTFHVGGAPIGIPSQLVGRAMNACRNKDIACDFSVHGSTTVHTTYQNTSYPAQLGRWLVGPTVARSQPAPIPVPGPGPGPGPGTTPQVALAQGPTAPAGYRYAITLSGFAPGVGVSITCYDSVSPGGFYSFTLTTDGSGGASTASYCYSGDGPDHWVIAGGVESNHVSWGAAPPPPSPSVGLAQGPAGPAGYRYAITLSGFSPGASIPITCYDSVSPGGFYSFSLTTDGAGNAYTASQCYSGDHPDHWVVAGGIGSNHVTW